MKKMKPDRASLIALDAMHSADVHAAALDGVDDSAVQTYARSRSDRNKAEMPKKSVERHVRRTLFDSLMRRAGLEVVRNEVSTEVSKA